MNTSDYRIHVLGSEGFILPYSLLGADSSVCSNMEEAGRAIKESDLKNTVFILDEGIIENISKVAELEEEGANITILRAWGKSEMAERKIRAASIKAIGTEIS